MATNDNISKLHQALKNEGYNDIGSEEQFRAFVTNSDNVKRLHQSLKDAGYNDIGSEDEFSQWLGTSSTPPATQTDAAPDTVMMGEDGTFTESQLGAMENGAVPVAPGTAEVPAAQSGQVLYGSPEWLNTRVGATDEAATLVHKKPDGSAPVQPELNSDSYLGRFAGRVASGNPYYGMTRQEALNEVKRKYLHEWLNDKDRFDKVAAELAEYGITSPDEIYKAQRDIRNSTVADVARHRVESLLSKFDKLNYATEEDIKALIESRETQKDIDADLGKLGWWDQPKADESTDEATADWLKKRQRAHENTKADYYNYLYRAMTDALQKKYGWRPVDDARGHTREKAAELIPDDQSVHEERIRNREALGLTQKYLGDDITSVINLYDKAANKIMQEHNESVSPYSDPGFDLGSVVALGKANKSRDPEKILKDLTDRAKTLFDNLLKKEDFVNDVTKQAEALGISPEEYVGSYVAPNFVTALQREFENTMIAREMPESDFEYIMRGLTDNSVIGMLWHGITDTKSQIQYRDMANAKYGEDAGMLTNVGQGVVSFIGDGPLWAKWAKVGGTLAKKEMAELMVQEAARRGVSLKVVERAMAESGKHFLGKSIPTNMLQGATQMAVTMAGAETTSGVVRDITRGADAGTIIGNAIGTAVGEGLKGAVVGSTIGALNPWVAKMSGAAKVAGKILSFGAEASTFYTAGEIEKLLKAEGGFSGNVGEGLLESAVNLAMIKLTNLQTLRKIADTIRHPKRALEAQKTELNDDDVRRIMENTDGADLFDAILSMSSARADGEREGNVSDAKLQQLADNYRRFMTNPDIPAETKQKVARLTGGIIQPPGAEVSADIIEPEAESDGYVVRTRDIDGQCVREHRYDSREEADKAADAMRGELFANTTEALEGKVNSTDAYRRFTEYFENAYREVSEKILRGEELTKAEQQAIYLHQHQDELLDIYKNVESGEELSEGGQSLADLFRQHFEGFVNSGRALKEFTDAYEREHGLEPGSLHKALEKDVRTEEEVQMLLDYQEAMRNHLSEEAEAADAERTVEEAEAEDVTGQRMLENGASDHINPAGNVSGNGNAPAEGSGPGGSGDTAGGGGTSTTGTSPAGTGRTEAEGMSERRRAAYERGRSALQDQSQLPVIEYERQLAYARMQQLFPVNDPVMSHLRNDIIHAVEAGDDAEVERLIKAYKGYLTPQHIEAIEQWCDADEMSRGSEDAKTAEVQAFEQERRAQLEPMAAPDGSITELVLDDGSTVYYMQGDLNNAYGGVTVKTADGEAKQIKTNSVKSIGERRLLNDVINAEVDAYGKRLDEQYGALAQGKVFVPGSRVDLMIAGKPFVATVGGSDQAGNVMFVLEDGSQIPMSAADASKAVMDANRAKIDTQLKQEREAATMSQQRERFGKGVVGYADGMPDLTAAGSDPKVVAEYLEASPTHSEGKDPRSHKETLSSIQGEIDRLNERQTNDRQTISTLTSKRDIEGLSEEDEQALADAEASIADAEARRRKWGEIRQALMTDEERQKFEAGREKEIQKARQQVEKTQPAADASGTVATPTGKELLEQFAEQGDAARHVDTLRGNLKANYRDELVPQLTEVRHRLSDYRKGLVDLSDAELQELTGRQAALEAQDAAMVAQSRELSKLASSLGRLYAERNKAAMSPHERKIAAMERESDPSKKIKLAREAYADDEEALSVLGIDALEPQDVYEWIAANLGQGVINWEGIQRGEHYVRGLIDWFGHDKTRGVGKKYDTNGINYFLAPDGKGMGIDELVHHIAEESPYDDTVVANALDDMLRAASKPTDITNRIVDDRIGRAEEIYNENMEREREAEEEAKRQAEDDAIMQQTGMTPEEYDAFIGDLEQRLAAQEGYKTSDEYFNQLAEDNDRENERRAGGGQEKGALAEQGQENKPSAAEAAGEGGAGKAAIAGIKEKEQQYGIKLSDEVDQNGSPYVISSNNTIDFGQITADKNLPAAPIRMALGDSENGYIHIENRHGKQIRNAGYNSVADFVEYIANNFTDIVKGDAYENESGGANQSYLVQLRDGHNNTIWMQLSRDGSYWNVNSAGIMSKRYGKNKETVWSASEVQNSGPATADNVSQYEPNADDGSSSNGTTSNVSSGKGRENNSNEQEKEGKKSILKPKIELEDDPNYSDEERKALQYRDGESFEEYSKRNNSNVYDAEMARLYLQQKYADRLDDIADIIGNLTLDNVAEAGKKIGKLVGSRDEGYAMLFLLRNIPVETILSFNDAVSEVFDKKILNSQDDASFPARLAAAKKEVNTAPTEAQKEAGNYKKGHVSFGGYDYTIENPKGSVRSGVDANGKPWSQEMKDTYGYILGKIDKDGDHIDMFINDNADLDSWDGMVYVVDQASPNPSEGGRFVFDEHKVMYGYGSWKEAKQAYERNYEPGWWDSHVLQMTGVKKADFDKWLADSDRKLKPFAEYVRTKNADTVSDNVDQLIADVRERLRNEPSWTPEEIEGMEDDRLTQLLRKRQKDLSTSRYILKAAGVEGTGSAKDKQLKNNVLKAESDVKALTAEARKRLKTRAEQGEIGGAMVEQLEKMGFSVSTDPKENRRVRKLAERDKSDEGKLRHFETTDGEIYGFTYKGKMYLDPTKINAELPVHEYAHPWCEAFRRLNPDGWKDIVGLMKGDEETWDFVKAMNPDLKNEDDIAEEMIAKFSGKKGAERAEAEYKRMNGSDPDYKSKWGNIWKNISKAIQDFWKSVGDFLHIKYDSAEQVYDQVVKDFANNINPRKRVEKWLQERDKSYIEAVGNSDTSTAKELFDQALRENIGNGITPFIAVDGYRGKMQKLAHAIKERDPKVIAEVADMMAPLIPNDAVLIPAPSHSGEATDMLDLAKAISERTGAPVADVLKSGERPSQYEAKKAGKPLSTSEMGIAVSGELPEGKLPVVIDNVVDTGNTAEACVQALGKAIVASLADSADRYRHVASLKSAEPVVVGKDGKVVPLSQRFEIGGKYLDKAEKPAADALGTVAGENIPEFMVDDGVAEAAIVTDGLVMSSPLGRRVAAVKREGGPSALVAISDEKTDTYTFFGDDASKVRLITKMGDVGQKDGMLTLTIPARAFDTIAPKLVAKNYKIGVIDGSIDEPLRKPASYVQGELFPDEAFAQESKTEEKPKDAVDQMLDEVERRKEKADEKEAEDAVKRYLSGSPKNAEEQARQRATKAVLRAMDKAGVPYKVASKEEEKQMMKLFSLMNQEAVKAFARRASIRAYSRHGRGRYIVYDMSNPFGVPVYAEKLSVARFELKQLKHLVPDGDWAVLDIGWGDEDAVAQQQTLRKAAELYPDVEAMMGWHGSGAQFDAFDHRHIGSGEGAQSYGWGTYITEVEGIGRMYAEAMGDRRKPATYKGLSYSAIRNLSPEDYGTVGIKNEGERVALYEIVASLNYGYGDPVAMLRVKRESLQEKINNKIATLEEQQEELKDADGEKKEKLIASMKRRQERLESLQSQLAFVNSLAPKDFKGWSESDGSFLYKVDIPDDNGSNYFDWTENVPEERADKILAALEERLLADDNYGWNKNKASRARLKEELNRMRYFFGATFYGRMSVLLGNSVAGAERIGKRLASELLHDNGYVGIKYPAEYMTGGRKDGAKNYVIFDEKDAKITDTIQFMVEDDMADNGPIFVSNALKAVEGIKQEKATAEQWLAMVQKNGGLKVGEDKWLGLSEWLQEQASTKRSLTRNEVLDFIRKNQIEVEEEHYDDLYHDWSVTSLFTGEWEAYQEEAYDKNPDVSPEEQVAYAWKKMCEKYGASGLHGFNNAFHFDYYGQLAVDNYDEAARLAKEYKGVDLPKHINSARLGYTTAGLKNNREIALVVPTVEPWNESDEIHFGDAGEGRAVAWVRFGDAYAPNMGGDPSSLSDGVSKVLVIDEIQSKRHQEGRTAGYQDSRALRKLHDEYQALGKQKRDFFKDAPKEVTENRTHMEQYINSSDVTDEVRNKYYEIEERQREIFRQARELRNGSEIPDAPFDKNWHELAMKRMMRYAAEHGYDKVAWTKGEQQAERYNIGHVVYQITSTPYEAQSPSESNGHDLLVNMRDGSRYEMFVQPDGTLNSNDELFDGKNVVEVFGKDLGEKITSAQEEVVLKDDALRIGAEGMKGFYDEMLPRFMNKYGKKWGVKVGEVQLPGLENSQDGVTMWSVDVTPEMRESVMQGQPMFQKEGKRILGWSDSKGVHLTESGLNPNTPLHECTHLWDKWCQKEQPDLWKEVVWAMKQSPLWEEIRKNPNYRNIWEDENRMASEVHSRLSGAASEEEFMKAAFKKDTPQKIIDEVKSVLKRFWEAILRLFGKQSKTIGSDWNNTRAITLMPLRDLLSQDFEKVIRVMRDVTAGEAAGTVEGHIVEDKNEIARLEMYRHATPEVEKANAAFNKRLAELDKDRTQKNRVLKLGNPGVFLLSGGIQKGKITMDFDRFVKKSSENYEHKHPFTADDIKDLPKAINTPIAVFKSQQQNNDYTILTELRKEGRNFVVAIRASEQPRKGGVTLSVNEITTLYPKNAKGIVKWFIDGHATNVDKNKALQWITALRPHVGTAISVEELDVAAKIVKDFETPKLSEEKLQELFPEYSSAAEETGEILGGQKVILEAEGPEDGTLGWYDPNNHSVHVVLPAHGDVEEIKRTVFHEKLGHEGLVSLMGSQEAVNKFGTFIFRSASKDLRRRMLEKADEEGYSWDDPLRLSKAAQEVFGDIAADGPKTADEFTLWDKVKHYVIQLLKKLGIKVRGLVNDHDLAYYVLKTGEALKRWNKMSDAEKVAIQSQQTGHDIMRSRGGKPRKRKDESMSQYLQRLREWEKWKIAKETALANGDPMPDKDAIDNEWQGRFEADMEAWRSRNGVTAEETGVGTFPKRGENETPQEYAIRVAEYETKADLWKGAPDYFSYMQKAQEAYKTAYTEWKRRYDLQEEENVDLAMYEGGDDSESTATWSDVEAEARAERDMANALGVQGAKRHAKLAVIERRKNLESSNAEDALWLHDFVKRTEELAATMTQQSGQKVTGKMIREALPFIIEETYWEEILRDDEGNFVAINDLRDQLPIKDTPELRALLSHIKEWYDQFFFALEDAGLRNDAGYIEDGYVNHIWDKSKSDPKAWEKYVENYQRTKSPNMRHREIETYQEGIDLGLVPKFKDIADIMAYYSRSNNEALANKKFLDDLSFMCVEELNSDGEVVSVLPLLNSHKDAINADRYVMYHIPGVGDVYVLKDVQKRFANIFGTMRTQDVNKWLEATGKVWDITGSTAKKIELALSGFHALALWEVDVAQNGPLAALKDLFKYIVVDSAMKGTLPAYAHPEDFKFAASHLVQLGATEDYAAADVNNITGKLRELVEDLYHNDAVWKKAAGVAGSVPAILLDWVNKGFDKALWNYLHDGLKIASFKRFAAQVERRVAKEGLSDDEGERLLDEAGQYVNDMFGGQYWELLNVSPGTLKWMRRLLLSPDWLVSTNRHFLANFGFGSLYSDGGWKEYLKYNWNNIKRAVGAKIEHDELRRFRSRNSKICYLIGVLFFWNIIYNALNALNRKRDEEKWKAIAEEMRKTNPDYKSPYELAYPDGMKWYDYTMWGNAIGQQTHLFSGRYDDGTETYVRWGKQFREFPEMFIGRHGLEFPAPLIERMMSKANPNLGGIFDFLGAIGARHFEEGYESRELREKYGRSISVISSIARHFIPFGIPTQADKEYKTLDFFMPSSKGFSRYKATDYFKTFIIDGDMRGVEQTYQAAVMNGVDAEACLKAAIASVKAEQRKELKDGVTDLQSAAERFDAASGFNEKVLMRKKIHEYLAGEDYRSFSRDEALEQVRTFLEEGTQEKIAKDDELYVVLQNSDDVIGDWRLNAIDKQAKKYTDEVNAALERHDFEKATELAKRYNDWFVIREYLSNWRNQLRMMKREELGKGNASDDRVMEEIRKQRRETMAAIDSIQGPK